MRPPADAIQTDGRGPDVVFIHGAAVEKASWRSLVVLLRERVRATVYDRRGTATWPVADDIAPLLVEEHAEDLADLIQALGASPVHLCAISFGAVVAIDLLKRRPELVRSAVLFEPALSGDDRISSVPRYLTDKIETLVADGRPEDVAEHFCRMALGDVTWSLLPGVIRREMRSRGKQIRRDLLANAAYQVHYEELREVDMPVLLLQGGRSRKVFDRALQTLRLTLPRAEHKVIDQATHVPFGDAWREFASAVTDFIGA